MKSETFPLFLPEIIIASREIDFPQGSWKPALPQVEHTAPREF
jgi:hypothetical protein